MYINPFIEFCKAKLTLDLLMSVFDGDRPCPTREYQVEIKPKKPYTQRLYEK